MPKTNGSVTKDDLRELKREMKDDMEEFAGQIIKATQKGFEEVENRFDGVENRLDGVESGLRDVKRQLTDLQMDTPTSREFLGHEKRIRKIEEKVFIAND